VLQPTLTDLLDTLLCDRYIMYQVVVNVTAEFGFKVGNEVCRSVEGTIGRPGVGTVSQFIVGLRPEFMFYALVRKVGIQRAAEKNSGSSDLTLL
jgi:hypothetical protein